jgi:hypothetical protein
MCAGNLELARRLGKGKGQRIKDKGLKRGRRLGSGLFTTKSTKKHEVEKNGPTKKRKKEKG